MTLTNIFEIAIAVTLGHLFYDLLMLLPRIWDFDPGERDGSGPP